MQPIEMFCDGLEDDDLAENCCGVKVLARIKVDERRRPRMLLLVV